MIIVEIEKCKYRDYTYEDYDKVYICTKGNNACKRSYTPCRGNHEECKECEKIKDITFNEIANKENENLITRLDEIKRRCDVLINLERQNGDWNTRMSEAGAIESCAGGLWSKYVNINTDLFLFNVDQALERKRRSRKDV